MACGDLDRGIYELVSNIAMREKKPVWVMLSYYLAAGLLHQGETVPDDIITRIDCLRKTSQSHPKDYNRKKRTERYYNQMIGKNREALLEPC